MKVLKLLKLKKDPTNLTPEENGIKHDERPIDGCIGHYHSSRWYRYFNGYTTDPHTGHSLNNAIYPTNDQCALQYASNYLGIFMK